MVFVLWSHLTTHQSTLGVLLRKSDEITPAYLLVNLNLLECFLHVPTNSSRFLRRPFYSGFKANSRSLNLQIGVNFLSSSLPLSSVRWRRFLCNKFVIEFWSTEVTCHGKLMNKFCQCFFHNIGKIRVHLIYANIYAKHICQAYMHGKVECGLNAYGIMSLILLQRFLFCNVIYGWSHKSLTNVMLFVSTWLEKIQ